MKGSFRRWVLGSMQLVVMTLLTTAAAPALADDLGHVESAHQEKGTSSKSSSGSTSKSGHGDGDGVAKGIVGSILSGLFESSSSDGSTEGGDEASARPHSLAMFSYDEDHPEAYAERAGPDARMARYGELSLSGFTTFTPTVQGLDGQLNLFVSAFTLHGEIERYYEPNAQTVRSLDLYRLQVGFNLFHGWVKSAELHVTGGLLGLHGDAWTPAGSVRTDLRLYPVRPVSVDLMVDASFFAHGSPLLEAQLLPGATFARVDLRVGAGLLYQPGVGPFLGPRIQIGIRF